MDTGERRASPRGPGGQLGGVQQPHLLSATIRGSSCSQLICRPLTWGPRGRRRHALLLLPHPPRLPPSVCLPGSSSCARPKSAVTWALPDLHLLSPHCPGGALTSSPHVTQKLVPTASFSPTGQPAACPGQLDPKCTLPHTRQPPANPLHTLHLPVPTPAARLRLVPSPVPLLGGIRHSQALPGACRPSPSQVSALFFPSCLHPQAPRVGPSHLSCGCHLSRASPQLPDSDPNFWPLPECRPES